MFEAFPMIADKLKITGVFKLFKNGFLNSTEVLLADRI